MLEKTWRFPSTKCYSWTYRSLQISSLLCMALQHTFPWANFLRKQGQVLRRGGSMSQSDPESKVYTGPRAQRPVGALPSARPTGGEASHVCWLTCPARERFTDETEGLLDTHNLIKQSSNMNFAKTNSLCDTSFPSVPFNNRVVKMKTKHIFYPQIKWSPGLQIVIEHNYSRFKVALMRQNLPHRAALTQRKWLCKSKHSVFKQLEKHLQFLAEEQKKSQDTFMFYASL